MQRERMVLLPVSKSKKEMKLFVVVALFALFPLAAFSLEVTVGIAPQKYITEKIGGDLVTVHTLMDKGADPHSFSPKPAQAASLARSSIFFGIGFPYEKVFLPNLEKTFKNLKVIDTSAGLTDSENDPHLWTNPKSVKGIARATFEALAAEDPAHEAEYRENYLNFLNDVTLWDDRFTALFAESSNRSFLVYHPFLGYFARDYGLTQYSVELEGKSPKPRELALILDTVKRENITLFFTVRTHSEEPAEFIANQSGLKIISIDNLNEDWQRIMTELYDAFSR